MVPDLATARATDNGALEFPNLVGAAPASSAEQDAAVAETGRSPTFSRFAALVETPQDRLDVARLRLAFQQSLPIATGTEENLAGVLRSTLLAVGSLARARLAFQCMISLDVKADSAQKVAIAVEYFHTASLLFDDLPAMDDATERRGRICPHLQFGQAATMLGALAFIARGYELLWSVLAELRKPFRHRASTLVGDCLGASGVLEGQARDLSFGEWTDGRPAPEDVLRVAMGKTGTLIRLTLVLPALIAGRSEAEISHLELLAENWGLAYQIFDDCKDLNLSAAESGKTSARDGVKGRPNFPLIAGWTRTLDALRRLVGGARTNIDAVQSIQSGWAPLMTGQNFLENELAALESHLPSPLALVT